MKKYLIIIMLIIPIIGFAMDKKISPQPQPPIEDLIEETVYGPDDDLTYFIQYPNGRETVTLDYRQANNPDDLLIYEGVTDNNGQIVIDSLDNKGELRVVQEVPDGYTTNNETYTIDLSKSSNVSFVNTKGIINPETGRYLSMFIMLVIALICLILISISRIQKSLKAVIIITVLSIIGLSNVKANTTDFTITVKDGLGRKMSGVTVKVYAKAYNVNAYPAIKISSGADDAYFFDGEQYFYIKLPENGCTKEQWESQLEREKGATYLRYLRVLTGKMPPYRVGYRSEGFVWSKSDTYSNGEEYSFNWTENSDNNTLYTIYGNGATFNFYHKTLSNIKGTFLKELQEFAQEFKENNKYNVGIDNNPECSNYPFGIRKSDRSIDNTNYYVCSFEKPDGLYINEDYYSGNIDNCFSTSDANFNQSIVYIRDVLFYGFGERYIGYINTINNLELVNHGESLFSLTSSDLAPSECKGMCYFVSDSTKRSIVVTTMEQLYNKCATPSGKEDDGKKRA